MWTDLVCRLRALFARKRVESELDEELRFHVDRQVEVYRLAGIDAAHGGRFLVTQLATPANPVSLDVSIDGPVLAFALAATVLTALLFGTAPALHAARVVPMDALRAQGHATEEGRPGLMAWLVVAQVAFSVVLVVAAGLFIRSFVSLANRDLGLNADPVLVVTLDAQRTTIEPSVRAALYERIRAAVLALPDVAAAAMSLQTPGSGGGFTPAVEVVDAAGASRSRRLVPADGDVFGNLVSTGWFRTFGTPLTAGRDFEERDRRGARRVVIVNETFARRFFAKRSPLGQTVVVYPNTPRAMPAQIVGVAADAIYGSPREAVPPTWYMPLAQFGIPEFPFVFVRLNVRANAGSPGLLTKSVAAAIAEVDPQLALTFRPLATQIHAALTRERLMAQLAGALGVLALILAGLGLYGVTAYAISRQRTEIAVRIAIGALPGRVMTVVLARVWLLVGLGIVSGMGISLWASRFVGGPDLWLVAARTDHARGRRRPAVRNGHCGGLASGETRSADGSGCGPSRELNAVGQLQDVTVPPAAIE
jgi:predicted permease